MALYAPRRPVTFINKYWIRKCSTRCNSHGSTIILFLIFDEAATVRWNGPSIDKGLHYSVTIFGSVKSVTKRWIRSRITSFKIDLGVTNFVLRWVGSLSHLLLYSRNAFTIRFAVCCRIKFWSVHRQLDPKLARTASYLEDKIRRWYLAHRGDAEFSPSYESSYCRTRVSSAHPPQ